MLGEKVKHIKYGEGTVSEVNDSIISVTFTQLGEMKSFSYPKSFEKYICFLKQELQLQAMAIIEAEKEKEAVLKANRENEIKEVLNINNVRTISHRTTKKSAFKTVLKGNIAMKCTFCDGGSSMTSLGFAGVCSTENINRNIEQGRVNCNDSDCRKYYDGEMTYQELIKWNHGGEFLCYDSAFLKDWRVYAGSYHNGANKGKPMKFRNIQKDKLTVLTTRVPGTSESERVIFGVYIVKDYFEGNNLEEGYIDSVEEYRLELTPEEAESIKFWKYYYNEKSPKRIQFGSGLHRYLSNEQAVQILKDVVDIKNGSKDEQMSKELLEHYLSINGLELDTIGEAMGPLA